MPPLARHGRACALLMIASAPALAGPGQPPEQADAPVPPTHYRSVFADDAPFRHALAPWRAVNDTVGRLGGHMGHMPALPALPAIPDAPQPHEHMHGGAP